LNFLPPSATGTLGVLAASSSWKFNTAPLQNSVHIATYTSNQDVRPPPMELAKLHPRGDRKRPHQRLRRHGCAQLQSRARRYAQSEYLQQPHHPRLAGLLPQNTKPLSTDLQRAFVVLVQNFTDFDKSFRLMIANQPTGGKASFLQFPTPPAPDPLTVLDVTIAAHSGVARSVFATATDPHAIIRINAAEITSPPEAHRCPAG